MVRLMPVFVAAGLCLALAAPVPAQTEAPGGSEPGWVSPWESWVANNGVTPKVKAPPVELAGASKPIPMSFRVEYGLSSDYVWRGMNLTEFGEKHGERCNQSLGVAAEIDTKVAGAVGVAVWMDWWSGLERAMGEEIGCKPLENDYTVYWRIPVKQIHTTFEVGWNCLHFPAVGIGGTQEVYVSLTFDDSPLWGTGKPVLNPYVYYALDYDWGDNGSWIEIGAKPVISLAELSCTKDLPVLKDSWVSPSVSLGIDHRYYGGLAEGFGGELADYLGIDKHTRCANVVFGFEYGYDLTRTLGIRREGGTVTLIGFLNYSQALQKDLINDEFWGGVKLAWSW